MEGGREKEGRRKGVREGEREVGEGGKEGRKGREEGKGREKEKFLKLGSLCLVHNLSILFEYLLD